MGVTGPSGGPTGPTGAGGATGPSGGPTGPTGPNGLAFSVTDDDGIVSAHSVVTHTVACSGMLTTDKVTGVSYPGTTSSSGIVVLAAPAGSDNNVSISYINTSATGNTNGSQTYTIWIGPR